MATQANAAKLESVDWAELLRTATTEPGVIKAAYSAFHNYSTGNQMLAWWQCTTRNLPIGPISTFKGWQAKGRMVSKGSKALSLYMPITGKYEKDNKDNKETGEKEVAPYMKFALVNRWFVLGQTDGETMPTIEAPKGWSQDLAFKAFNMRLVPFEMFNGNVQGYCSPNDRPIAINPLASDPMGTLFHEMGHVLLHDSSCPSEIDSSRSIKEMEAECVSLLVSATLGLGNEAEHRGYIQSWFGKGNLIPDKNAHRVFSAADRIIKAGFAATKAETE